MFENRMFHTLMWLAAAALFAVLAYAQVSTEAIHIEGFSGDSLFVIDVIARMAAGQVPHVDFTLHLGALPFAVIDAVNTGPIARAYVLGQLLFTGFALWLALWIARTRLDGLGGGVLAFAVVVLGSSLSTDLHSGISVALFYNRWAWVLALLFACVAFLDRDGGKRAAIDGAAIGLLAFALLTTKITFFAALVPLALLRFGLARRWREIIAGLACFGLCIAACVAVWGNAIWPAYLENLIWVAINPLRDNAGIDFTMIVIDPANLSYWLALGIFLLIVWRQLGVQKAVWMALLMLAFVFIQYQNFGNVPLWILMLAIACFGFGARSDGAVASVWLVIGLGFTWLSLTPLTPMANSSFANLALVGDPEFQPLYAEDPRFDGFYYLSGSFAPPKSVEVVRAAPLPPLASRCRATSGFAGIYQRNAALMAELGGPALVLDTPTPEWMFSGGPPLHGAAPWNYGSLRGLNEASAVIIPVCVTKPSYQIEMLREIERLGFVLTETRRTEDGIVYEVSSMSDDS